MSRPNQGKGLATSERRQTFIPKQQRMKHGDRVYGIDADRSSAISAYATANRRQMASPSSLKPDDLKPGFSSPLKINDLNDAWIAQQKGLTQQLRGVHGKTWRSPEYKAYSAYLDAYDETRALGQELATARGRSTRSNTEQRRRAFGLLSKAGINFAYANGRQIFQMLDHAQMTPVFTPRPYGESSSYFGSVSSQELRHEYNNRTVLAPHTTPDTWQQNTVRFFRAGQEVAPPWVNSTNAALQGYSLMRRPSMTQMTPMNHDAAHIRRRNRQIAQQRNITIDEANTLRNISAVTHQGLNSAATFRQNLLAAHGF